MDTLSQPFTSQSQGYCSYSQQQQEVQCSSKAQNDADHQSVEEIIRYHTAFMSKSMSTNLNISMEPMVSDIGTSIQISEFFKAHINLLKYSNRTYISSQNTLMKQPFL